MGDLVTLDGSASIFPDANSPPLFLWDQLEGPSVTLSDPLSMNPTFVPTQEGVYRFELRTYDGQRASRPDEVTITVVPASPGRGRGKD